MELKEYQTRVLERFEDYLQALELKRIRAKKILEIDLEENPKACMGDFPREAWDDLNNRRLLPEARSLDGTPLVAPYLSRKDGYGLSIPNVCLKVPTGGGKTLLAASALERLHADYFNKQTGFVLWVVPSEAIYRQTWKSLANREHPYRQILERASGGRVKMLEKGDAFNRADFRNYLCVMVLMLQSSARKSKETLRMFRDSGKFTDFFPEVDDSSANHELLLKVPNLDQNDLSFMSYLDGIFPGSISIKQSLGNTLRLLRPVIVVDEGHKAYTDTARDTLSGFNPSFMLELSATPNTGGKHQSNILVDVPGNALKMEEMIKLPINIINNAKGDWKHTLTEAHDKLKELRKGAESVQGKDGRYIRPIMLVRVERTGRDQRDGKFVHAEDAKEFLLEKCGVLPNAIRFKTSDKDELGDTDLLSETCPVEVIITKDALREGWDCPFAYVLAILSITTANTALTQMIGRVLRQPYAQLTSLSALNECYVFTFDQEVQKAVECVRKGLQNEGMGDLGSSVRIGGSAGTDLPVKRVVIRRNEVFRGLPIILLPRLICKDEKAKGGYRVLDYDRDILGELDWESLHYLGAESFVPEEVNRLERTLAKVNIEVRENGQFDFSGSLSQEEDEIPTEGLDLAFLIRQLTDVIPNPWQGARILEETLGVLRGKMDEARLYLNRLALIAEMKKDLRLQLYGGTYGEDPVIGVAEKLFRNKLKAGEIQFSLMTANNPDLDWKLAETLEIDLAGTETELSKKNGSPLERQLFERVFDKDFNALEKSTAWYLDGAEAVRWWHRIAVNHQSYSLQGWQKNKVYPDLLACVHGTGPGKYRLSILETKGNHLSGNDDTAYKKALFDLLNEYAAQSFEAGELLLGEDTEQMTFTMLLEHNWEQEISKII